VGVGDVGREVWEKVGVGDRCEDDGTLCRLCGDRRTEEQSDEGAEQPMHSREDGNVRWVQG